MTFQKAITAKEHTTVQRSIGKPDKPIAKRGRPVGDHEAKRAGLLDAANSVIAELGYAGTSLRKVAERAGHTTGAVTYYFDNKLALAIAVVESNFDRYDSLLDEPDGNIDVRALFERWLGLVADPNQDSWRASFQFLAEARNEPKLAAVIQRRFSQYRQKLALSLARSQGRGIIRDDIAADILADQICAIGDGWMMTYPIEPERFKPKRMQALLDSTIMMIAPQKKATSARTKRS